MSKEARIQELEGKIVSVCVTYPHVKGVGWFECDRKRSQCHSKRVRWLDEIKQLEVEHGA